MVVSQVSGLPWPAGCRRYKKEIEMKTTATYWNPLIEANIDQWEEIDGTDGHMRQITLAQDPETGDYTRLTWFRQRDSKRTCPSMRCLGVRSSALTGQRIDQNMVDTAIAAIIAVSASPARRDQ